MKTMAVAAGIATGLLFAGAAQAQPVVYTWSGMGLNVPGSAKCSTYHMTIELMVDGNKVRGVLKQQGRPERSFETTKDAKGAFTAKVHLADDSSTMDVTGTLADDDSRVLLDGYCKFEGKLTPQ
jgi:hypothetical protein